MKIILSPAKKMIVDTDNLVPVELPVYIDKTAEVLNWIKSKSKEELKAIWKCNDKIAEQNFNRLENMDFITGSHRLFYHMKELLFNIWHHPCLKIVSLSMYKII